MELSFLHPQLFPKLPYRIFQIKNKQRCQHQETDSATDHRRISKFHQAGPDQKNRHAARHCCLDKIKQIFFPLQPLDLRDKRHRAEHRQRANRKHKVHRPAPPARENIPEHGDGCHKKQLPHLVFQKIPPLPVSHSHNQPGAETACSREPEPV